MRPAGKTFLTVTPADKTPSIPEGSGPIVPVHRRYGLCRSFRSGRRLPDDHRSANSPHRRRGGRYRRKSTPRIAFSRRAAPRRPNSDYPHQRGACSPLPLSKRADRGRTAPRLRSLRDRSAKGREAHRCDSARIWPYRSQLARLKSRGGTLHPGSDQPLRTRNDVSSLS
jgi:hypothetical protein